MSWLGRGCQFIMSSIAEKAGQKRHREKLRRLDFDHRPGEKKLFLLTDAPWHKGMGRIRKEIAKCDLVCSNCHRMRTWLRRVCTKVPLVTLGLWYD